jgi:hypothetical protein
LQRKEQGIGGIMSNDFWRQWQTRGPFAWSGGAPSAPAGFPPNGFGPFADSAERFAAAAREFAANAHRAAAPSTDASQAAFAAAEGFGNFLRDHFAGCFRTPWAAPPGPAPAATAFDEAPALGLAREQVLRAQRAAEAWTRLMEAQDRLQRLWSDTLRDAAIAFSSRPPPAPGETLTQEAIDRLYDQWIDCAEEAYARTAHSDAFCDALAAYVNAGSQWRRESAADIEEWAKLLDLPTRSEINALTLRLRVLEAQLAAMKGPTRSAGPAPSATRARSARPAPSPKPPRSSKHARSASPRAAGSKRSR